MGTPLENPGSVDQITKPNLRFVRVLITRRKAVLLASSLPYCLGPARTQKEGCMQTTSAASDRLTRPQAAKYLGISIFTLNAWESEGRAPRSTRAGRHSIYLRSDLDSFLVARQSKPMTVPAAECSSIAEPSRWPAGSRVMRLREVCHLTGLSKTTIYKLGRDGCFVPSISLGGTSVGWPSHLVESWLAEQLKKAMGAA